MMNVVPDVPASPSTMPAPPAVLFAANRQNPSVPVADALVVVMAFAVHTAVKVRSSVAPDRLAPVTGSPDIVGSAVYEPAFDMLLTAVIAPPLTVTDA
jgi:hypothetical protein